ncbi:hypothetical protein RE003_002025 [Klebsiella variicola]|nr:hypothetical protein [Klebsiella variicola]
MNKIQYLLVGYGRDGEIHEDTELKSRLNIFESSVGSSHRPPNAQFNRSYDVHLIPVDGKVYAVGVGRTLHGNELPDLISLSGISPVPKEFTH